MGYFFTNEIVFCGHPDKICDQISDAIVDAYMLEDPNSHCAIEVMGCRNNIYICGEVKSKAKFTDNEILPIITEILDYHNIDYIEKINFTVKLNQQSPDINQGVETGGAGDQGMVYGYACRDTEQMLPKAQVMLQDFSQRYDGLRSFDSRFKSDGKAQITGFYNSYGVLIRIEKFVVSYHNTEQNRKETDDIIKELVYELCAEYAIDVEEIIINPTGKFEIGSFDGDTGLTGRKIIVDTYHSFAHHGGGAFSGKDPTKMDRSAAYKARQIAKRIVKEGYKWAEVQIAYAIGIEMPVSIRITTNFGEYEVPEKLYEECKPKNIIKDLKLKNISDIGFNYYQTALYGHFGNKEFPWER